MRIIKDIPELLNAGVITPDTAQSIRDYYKIKEQTSANRLFIVFGIFGALLVGLGIILIIAHNWDELSRSTKTLFSFLPLVLAQGLCAVSILYKPDNITWRESTTTLLFFSVGASISLIGQIYNIPGNLASFLLTWMLLCLPLIYVMKSSFASLLYLVGITYYAAETGYWSYPSSQSYLFWLLLLLALPHYYFLYKAKPKSNFMIFHNWMVPLSVVSVLGTVSYKTQELMFIAYFSLFGLLYLIGESHFFNQQKIRNNGFKVIGSLGTLSLLMTMSFSWFWEDLRSKVFHFDEIMAAPELYASAILTIMAIVLLLLNQKNKPLNKISPLAPVFIVYMVIFLLGLFSPIAVLLINAAVFIIGILIIREGSTHDHLGILNFGLLIITTLIICRFFDTDLSFVFRGILFVVVGAGFFATNYVMLQKRKTHE